MVVLLCDSVVRLRLCFQNVISCSKEAAASDDRAMSSALDYFVLSKGLWPVGANEREKKASKLYKFLLFW